MNLIDLFRIQWVERAGKIAIQAEGRTLTFGELDAQSNRVARSFQLMGLRHGDRVALYLGNSLELVVAYLANLKLGLVTVPLNTQYRDVEISHIINDATPRVVIVDRQQLEILKPLLQRLPTLEHVVLAEELVPLATVQASDPVEPGPNSEDLASLMYTSGTTGHAKGAMLTHNNLVANITGLVSAWRWTAEDTLLLALPLFHMHGLGVAFHGALTTGCSTILHCAFKADHVLDSLLTEEVTLFMGVPTMYVRLLAEAERRGLARVQLPRMRLFVSGSAPLSTDVFERFDKVFGHKILERYGMTETALTLSNLYAGPRIPGMVGVPLPGVSVRVVDERGDEVSEGQSGELVLRGSNVFRGYWRAPDKTAEAFLVDTTGDRWFRTGDLAKRDPANGYYMLISRRHDLIISGGFNIYPREIEEFLSQHPSVAEAAVIGIADAALGQVPVAFVAIRPEQKVETQELIDYCQEHLARYKVPRAVTFLDVLPRNAMGKISKKKLMEISQQPQSITTGIL